MAIRKWSLMGASELAQAPFRSLQEVDDYLDKVKEKLGELDSLVRQYQLVFSRNEVKSATEFRINKDSQLKRESEGKFKASKLAKIVVPNLTSLRSNFAVVNEYAEKIEELDVMYNSVAVKFKGMRGIDATLKSIKDTKAAAQTKMNKALDFLKEVGQKYAPEPFTQLVEKAMAKVILSIEYKKMNQMLYASETDKGHLMFSYYVELIGLKDQEGGIFPKFYIVFTCVLQPSATDKEKLDALYFVNTMHSFEAPGKYDKGKRIDSFEKAAQAISLYLDMENIGNAFGALPHGLDPKKWDKAKFSMSKYIETLTVDETSFVFDLVPGLEQKAANDIAIELFKDMKGAFADVKKAKIKVFLGKGKGDAFRIKYVLTNIAEGNKVSTNDLDFLREHLRLDEDKLRKITKIINND